MLHFYDDSMLATCGKQKLKSQSPERTGLSRIVERAQARAQLTARHHPAAPWPLEALGFVFASRDLDFPCKGLFRMGGLCREPYTPLPLLTQRLGGEELAAGTTQLSHGLACGSHATATGKRSEPSTAS